MIMCDKVLCERLCVCDKVVCKKLCDKVKCDKVMTKLCVKDCVCV